MKNKHRLLIFALFASAAALIVIIISAHQLRWGQYFPEQDVTPEEMVSRLKTSNVRRVVTGDSNAIDNYHMIYLETKFRFRYYTMWNQMSLADYDMTNAYDLVIQILVEERGLKDGKDFRLFQENPH